MRGRNPDNPSDRTPGIETEQRLAPCICAGMGVKQQPTMIIDDLYKNRDKRVYEEYAPTLRSNCYGLKVLERETISTKGGK